MHFRKCSGYSVYPLLAVLLFAPFALRAQDAPPQQQTPANQQAVPQPPIEPGETTPAQRAQVLREAQARVNARRQQRIRQIIRDTYSHKYEFDFGGGTLRFRPGQYLQHINEAGWHVGITDYLRGNLGVAVEGRGYYGTAYTGIHLNGVNEAYNPGISQYVFLAGPRYRFFRGQHWGWTAEVLAGAGHGNFATGTGGLGTAPVGLYNDGTVLNVAPGVSADYNLGPALAIRWSFTDLITNYSSSFQDKNLGGNMGIVYRFGRR